MFSILDNINQDKVNKAIGAVGTWLGSSALEWTQDLLKQLYLEAHNYICLKSSDSYIWYVRDT